MLKMSSSRSLSAFTMRDRDRVGQLAAFLDGGKLAEIRY
jgi:hypothetical protein